MKTISSIMLQICFQANHSQDWVFKISKIIQNFDYKYISEHVLLCTQNCHLKINSTHCERAGMREGGEPLLLALQKKFSLVENIGGKTQFTITRFHCSFYRNNTILILKNLVSMNNEYQVIFLSICCSHFQTNLFHLDQCSLFLDARFFSHVKQIFTNYLKISSL